MRSVALPGTSLEPSHLAFGSALLMARLGRRESVRLLEVAHDCGITHFDTARAYGYGEAESAVGDFLAGRREQVTVATKLGMVPPRRTRALDAAKSVARVVASRSPALRARLRARAQRMTELGRFEPAEARASLEASLRELRVDYVDLLLLHECRPADLETEGLLDFLHDVVREGKARAFGIATDDAATRAIVADRPEFAPVVQCANNVAEPILEEEPALAGRAVLTHSAVREVLPPVAALMDDRARRSRWSEQVGADCGNREQLGQLLLAYALYSNADGAVVFASTNEERIRSNARLADGAAPSREQVSRFAALAREELSGARSGAGGA